MKCPHCEKEFEPVLSTEPESKRTAKSPAGPDPKCQNCGHPKRVHTREATKDDVTYSNACLDCYCLHFLGVPA